MRTIIKNINQLGSDFSFSPEQWISAHTSTLLAGDVILSEVAELFTQQLVPPPESKYVLDTANARDGLLEIPILGNTISQRISTKKIACEGDVIISRLRPYLRQVALIPIGTTKLLGQEKFFCSTEFYVIRSKNKKLAAGIVAWLLSVEIQSMLSEAATGGHHPRFNSDLLMNAPIPKQYLDKEYCKSLESIFLGHIEGQRKLNILFRH